MRLKNKVTAGLHEIVEEIRGGKYNGILTWAPGRISSAVPSIIWDGTDRTSSRAPKGKQRAPTLPLAMACFILFGTPAPQLAARRRHRARIWGRIGEHLDARGQLAKQVKERMNQLLEAFGENKIDPE